MKLDGWSILSVPCHPSRPARRASGLGIRGGDERDRCTHARRAWDWINVGTYTCTRLSNNGTNSDALVSANPTSSADLCAIKAASKDWSPQRKVSRRSLGVARVHDV